MIRISVIKKHGIYAISLTLYLVLLGGLLSAEELHAQSVTFTSCELRHNVPQRDGKKMIQMHVSMKATDCYGHQLRAYMFVDIPKGTGHHFANGKKMITSRPLYCNSNNCNLNYWLGFFNNDLNPLPGKRTYYTRILVKDESLNRWIGSSDFRSFNNTGRQVQSSQRNNNNTHNNGQARSSIPAGMERCEICYGRGVVYDCEVCNGTGYWEGYGSCPICSNGYCHACNGRGYVNPATAPYRNGGNNGNVNTNKDNRSSGYTQIRKTQCPTCYGTTWVPNGAGVYTPYGSTECYSKYHHVQEHVCKIIMCPTCHKSHCETLSNHFQCPMCKGTGQVNTLN